MRSLQQLAGGSIVLAMASGAWAQMALRARTGSWNYEIEAISSGPNNGLPFEISSSDAPPAFGSYSNGVSGTATAPSGLSANGGLSYAISTTSTTYQASVSANGTF